MNQGILNQEIQAKHLVLQIFWLCSVSEIYRASSSSSSTTYQLRDHRQIHLSFNISLHIYKVFSQKDLL